MATEKERFPYIPLHVDDLTSDELVEAMSTEEFGAYMLLMFKAWKSDPPCTIPEDDITLARWSRLTDKKWKACKVRVLAPWTKDEHGRLFQKRLLKTRANVAQQIEKRRAAGAKGGKAKAFGGKQCSSIATALPEQSSSKGGSTDPSKQVADGYQSKSKTKVNTPPDGEVPPYSPPAVDCSEIVGIQVGERVVQFSEDHVVWIAEFVRQWNALPGVRKHDSSALSSVNHRSLLDRLREPDWDWKKAFTKFPLHLPDKIWQIALGTFLEEKTVSKILDGKYERSTTQSGGRGTKAIGAGQRYQPGDGTGKRGVNDF